MSLLCQHYSSDRAIAELGYSIRPLELSVETAWQWFIDNGYAKPSRSLMRRKAS